MSEYSSVAIEKQADFMMRLSEKFYGAVIVGTLGAPAFHWLETSGQGTVDAAYVSYVIMLVAGTVAGILLQRKAINTYKSLSR